MTKLAEAFVGIGLVVTLAAVTVAPSPSSSAGWAVEPTAQVKQAIDGYLLAMPSGADSNGVASRKLLHVSAPKTIRDSQLKQTIQAVKAEFVEEYERGVSFGADIQPRRYTIIIGFDGGKPLRWFYLGRGPKEYREAFREMP